jgi:catechol 2,3-dioxygenase
MNSVTTTPTATTAKPTLPDALRLGPVTLSVSQLDRSIAFYQDVIGLQVHRQDIGVAALGTGGEDLLVLTEELGAKRAGKHAGIYHFALLYETRLELAHAVLRLMTTRTPIDGASDHGVSEAIYLPDPDGIDIELYWDRPRDQWPAPDQPGAKVGMYTRALDIRELINLVAAEKPRRHAAPGLTIGHLHLYVSDLATTRDFYVNTIGLDVMTHFGPDASFLSAGGYHHHLGLNAWRGRGIPTAPPPAEVVGLHHYTYVLPTQAQVDDVRARVMASAAAPTVKDHAGGFAVTDPSGIVAAFVAAP